MKNVSTRLLSMMLLASALLVTGCATKFEKQAFNSEAATHIKKITVTQLADLEEYPVIVVNHPGNSFGLVGAVIVAADRAGKTKKLNEALDPTKAKIVSTFYDKAFPALKNIGYDVIAVPIKLNEKTSDIKTMTQKSQGQDASLFINFGAAYLAAGTSTDYYPSVALTAELTDTKTQAVLYRESYQYGYNNGVKEIAYLEAASACKFKDIDALTLNMDVTKKCLFDGVDVLVKQLVADLKK